MPITQNVFPYPEGEIPKPSVGSTIQYDAFSQQTQFANGRLRKRRLGVGLVYKVSMSWLFSPAEYDAFIGWWDRVLDQGTQEFSMKLTLGTCDGEWIGRFSSDPSITTSTNGWGVRIEAIFRKAPRRTIDQFLAMLSPAYQPEIMMLMTLLSYYYTERWNYGLL